MWMEFNKIHYFFKPADQEKQKFYFIIFFSQTLKSIEVFSKVTNNYRYWLYIDKIHPDP